MDGDKRAIPQFCGRPFAAVININANAVQKTLTSGFIEI
jgi:hypothetical protein